MLPKVTQLTGWSQDSNHVITPFRAFCTYVSYTVPSTRSRQLSDSLRVTRRITESGPVTPTPPSFLP